MMGKRVSTENILRTDLSLMGYVDFNKKYVGHPKLLFKPVNKTLNFSVLRIIFLSLFVVILSVM